MEKEFLRVIKNSLKIDPRTISIKTLLGERNLKRINYSPYYQRNYVWDKVKQSFFIESVILGTEIPPLIFFKSGLMLEVIDGRQRFETLKKFFENEITLTRRGLLTLVQLDRKDFNKIRDSKLGGIFLDSNIRTFEFEIINEPSLDSTVVDKVKKEIFRRYNTGITPLTNSEVDAAKYHSDKLTKLFEKEILKNQDFKEAIERCFFGGDTRSIETSKKTNYLRRLYILNRFPISKYAGSGQRQEIIDILYDFAIQGNSDPKEVKRIFVKQVDLVYLLYKRFTHLSDSYKNKLIYESVFWAISIIQSEKPDLQFSPLDYVEKLAAHYKNSIDLYDKEESHYYGNIIARFSNTAEIFSKLSGVDFGIYIRRADFTSYLNSRIAKEKNSESKAIQFDHLRMYKPSPISTPVEEIITEVQTTKYLIRPAYQRSERISELKASSIIESILLGIKLPPLFVLKRKDGVKEVVDGQQRILSFIGFLGRNYSDQNGSLQASKNNLFKLKGLKILKELNGKRYNQLEHHDKEKILDYALDIIIIDSEINPNFEPTDLFIRLNNKPYPIQQNSFEMWNSTVDRDVIMKIKELSTKNINWFYTKETEQEERNRRDRMQNEELITILSYLTLSLNEGGYDKVLGFFLRKDRITCRVKNKMNITDYLLRLDEKVSEKMKFIKCISDSEKKIDSLKLLFGGQPDKESLNSIFNIKGAVKYVRTFQDFYILWIVLTSELKHNPGPLDSNFIGKVKDRLGKLKNIKSETLDEIYLQDFLNNLSY